MRKRLGTVQNFTLTASSQVSAAKMGTETYSVLLTSSSTGTGLVGGYILFGDSTALTVSSTNGTLFPAPWVEAFDVTPGQTFAVIEASTQHATVSLTELT